MEPLLYLAHRIPYPPNKGDKIRSYNLLKHLAGHYRVHLGCFVDSPQDMQHVADLARLCADVRAVAIAPVRARLASMIGLLTGEALTLPYYRRRAMRDWVQATVATHGIRKAVAFSSPMAQYFDGLGLHSVVDLVDVDSAKWTAYAANHRWPLSALYRREGRRLLDFEKRAVDHAAGAVLVTAAEVALFESLAPGLAGRVHAIENGVDGDYFAPQAGRASPFPAGEAALVFTGAMDYWPNVDAVTWFVRAVLPLVVARRPDVRFHVVGMNPTPAVRALADGAPVTVTGAVPDVRPYLQHAAAVVAPLRVARGVQNKVLEAMAMARPVIVSAEAAGGIAAAAGVDFEVADDAEAFAQRTVAALDATHGAAMGARARSTIVATYDWATSLARFVDLLDAPVRAGRVRTSGAPADALVAG